MDAVSFLWLVLIAGCCFVVLVYVFRKYVPGLLSDLFKWGKTKKEIRGAFSHTFLEVPNSWFSHFYLTGIVWTLVLFCFLAVTCNAGSRGIAFMHHLVSPSSTATVPCGSVVISLVLLLFQVTRRFLECLFVSVFTGRIHVAHYLVGMMFYLLAGLSLSAPLLARNTLQAGWCHTCSDITSTWNLFDWSHWIGCTLFFWASWHQYKCHVILAKLRTSNTKYSSHKVHKIPYGDWFEHVSSPHYFAEILIYTSFTILQNGCNSYTWFMIVFVVLNLSLGASVTQHWYQEKFENYPKSRHRIFPFLY